MVKIYIDHSVYFVNPMTELIFAQIRKHKSC